MCVHKSLVASLPHVRWFVECNSCGSGAFHTRTSTMAGRVPFQKRSSTLRIPCNKRVTTNNAVEWINKPKKWAIGHCFRCCQNVNVQFSGSSRRRTDGQPDRPTLRFTCTTVAGVTSARSKICECTKRSRRGQKKQQSPRSHTHTHTSQWSILADL